MSTYSAGLSMAYSVLQRLDRLREHDLLDPLLPSSPSHSSSSSTSVRSSLPQLPPRRRMDHGAVNAATFLPPRFEIGTPGNEVRYSQGNNNNSTKTVYNSGGGESRQQQRDVPCPHPELSTLPTSNAREEDTQGWLHRPFGNSNQKTPLPLPTKEEEASVRTYDVYSISDRSAVRPRPTTTTATTTTGVAGLSIGSAGRPRASLTSPALYEVDKSNTSAGSSVSGREAPQDTSKASYDIYAPPSHEASSLLAFFRATTPRDVTTSKTQQQQHQQRHQHLTDKPAAPSRQDGELWVCRDAVLQQQEQEAAEMAMEEGTRDSSSSSPANNNSATIDATEPLLSPMPKAPAATAHAETPTAAIAGSDGSSNASVETSPPQGGSGGVAADEPPTVRFLRDLCRAGSAVVLQELTEMTALSNSVSDLEAATDSMALTALLNTRAALQHVVVPYLIGELSRIVDGASDGSCDEDRLSEWLCAIIGLGSAARDALPFLRELLLDSMGDARLVVLAMRAVGGAEGVRQLVDCLCSDTGPDASVRQYSAYGLGLLSSPIQGHTTVLCDCNPKVAEEDGPMHVYCPGDTLHRVTPELASTDTPPYRVTHIVLHNATACDMMRTYAASTQFRVCHEYPRFLAVLVDYCAFDVQRPSSTPQRETLVSSVLRYALAKQNRESVPDTMMMDRDLYADYDDDMDDTVFRVEEALVRAAVDSSEPSVQTQALLSLASLPTISHPRIAQAVTDVTLHLVGGACRGVQSSRHDDHNDADDATTLLVAAVRAMGCVSGSRYPGCTLQQLEAHRVLLRLLDTAVPCQSVVRCASCLALGAMGPIPQHTSSAVEALAAVVQEEGDARCREAAAWAMARLGPIGIGQLLGILRNCALTTEAHLAAARALEWVSLDCDDHSDGAAPSGSILEWLVGSLSSVIITPAFVAEEVVSACVHSLAAVVHRATVTPEEQLDSKYRALTGDEAANQCNRQAPSDCFEVLVCIVEAVVHPFDVLKAVFRALCAYGGCYGELYASQTVIDSPHARSRAAAAHGLRVCGPRVIRVLSLAMNDEVFEVREEAFRTLDAIGTDSVVALLRSRPDHHRQQVVSALRDCVLRDAGLHIRRAQAEALYQQLIL